MNLHDIRFRLTNVALWLHAAGRNGRSIGTHLWVIEEGQPPAEPQTRPSWTSAAYWTPNRFHWRPFQYNGLFRNGYVPPLCGQRSASQSPRIWEGDADQCIACLAEAAGRGIVPLTYRQATEQSPLTAAMAAERAEWQDAGRPSPWPPLPSDNQT